MTGYDAWKTDPDFDTVPTCKKCGEPRSDRRRGIYCDCYDPDAARDAQREYVPDWEAE